MKRDLFKRMLSDLIAGEQGEYPLDLRAGKAPFTHKDNDVFDINDLDGVYDYVNGSKEWFVDVYANTIIDRFPHADYTGSALTSATFEEALKSEPKTAYDKFVARLEELGLWEEWCQQGCVGRVGAETSEGIKILVHEDEDDRFTEFSYPPMREMEKSDQFRIKALEEFYPVMSDDKEFMNKLVRWVANPANVNPLFPVDVYFLWSDYTWQDFVDDKPVEVIKHSRKWEVLEQYQPNAETDWWVCDFENLGTLYMNNQDGYMVLYEINGTILKSDI